jgi:hypothetical protein
MAYLFGYNRKSNTTIKNGSNNNNSNNNNIIGGDWNNGENRTREALMMVINGCTNLSQRAEVFTFALAPLLAQAYLLAGKLDLGWHLREHLVIVCIH